MYQIITLDFKLTQSYMSTVLSVNMGGGDTSTLAQSKTNYNTLDWYTLKDTSPHLNLSAMEFLIMQSLQECIPY